MLKQTLKNSCSFASITKLSTYINLILKRLPTSKACDRYFIEQYANVIDRNSKNINEHIIRGLLRQHHSLFKHELEFSKNASRAVQLITEFTNWIGKEEDSKSPEIPEIPETYNFTVKLLDQSDSTNKLSLSNLRYVPHELILYEEPTSNTFENKNIIELYRNEIDEYISSKKFEKWYDFFRTLNTQLERIMKRNVQMIFHIYPGLRDELLSSFSLCDYSNSMYSVSGCNEDMLGTVLTESFLVEKKEVENNSDFDESMYLEFPPDDYVKLKAIYMSQIENLVLRGKFSWLLIKQFTGYCLSLSFPSQENPEANSAFEQQVRKILPWPESRLQIQFYKDKLD